jgi:hypothetical protein
VRGDGASVCIPRPSPRPLTAAELTVAVGNTSVSAPDAVALATALLRKSAESAVGAWMPMYRSGSLLLLPVPYTPSWTVTVLAPGGHANT